MAYAVTQDLVDRFGERDIARFSTPDGAAVVAVNEARCLDAIASAVALAESYLRVQVAVPMVDPPRVVVDCICDLARYELANGGGREPTDQIKTRRDERISWLNKIASGALQLSDTVRSASGAKGARFSDRGRVLSTDSLKGFV